MDGKEPLRWKCYSVRPLHSGEALAFDFPASPHAYLKLLGRKLLLVGQTRTAPGTVRFVPEPPSGAVRLPVGFLPALLEEPASELTDRVREIRPVDIGLTGDENLEAAFRKVRDRVQALWSLNHRSGLVSGLITLAAGHCHLRVSEVAYRSGYSARQLQRLFLTHTGFTTKEFLEICRFQRALESLDRGKIDLTDAALDAGYYDQSHFIRHFRRFSGGPPGRYRETLSDLSNQNVPLPATMEVFQEDP